MGAATGLTSGARVVLDTNVLVSTLILGGELVWLKNAWQRERLRPLASRATTMELIRVLAYPRFGLSNASREVLLAEYLPWCESVDVPPEVEVPPCRDPHDVMFLQLAVVAGADALATGDGDLPDLDGTISTPIMGPASLRRQLEGAPRVR